MAKLKRYSIETPPFAKGRLERDEDGDVVKWRDVQNGLGECIDELESIEQELVAPSAWESILCVLEDLRTMVGDK